MAIKRCKCGSITNSAVCDWIDSEDGRAKKCYIAIENGKWVKGCVYSETPMYMKDTIDKLLNKKIKQSMVIYKVTNLINGRIYVGKKINIKQDYYGSGKLIKLAIKKYGKQNFKREILQKCLKGLEEYNKSEKYWIKKLDCIVPKGYNLTEGGEGGDTFTYSINKEEQRKNKAIFFKKLWKNKKYRDFMIKVKIGKKRTLETKLRQSLAAKDKPKSENHKKHLSDAWKKRKIEKPTTEETLKKRSNSLKGKNTGKYIKIYEFRGSDDKIYVTSEGICKFAKKHHKNSQSFRDLIQNKIQEYHGWVYIRTIKE